MDLTNAWVVLVQGYTDQQGPAEYNRRLAERRAIVVKRFLIDLGVPESAIKMVTMGPDGLLCDDPGKECQELNRRVHLEFRKLAAAAPSTLAVAGPNASDRAQADVTSASGEPRSSRCVGPRGGSQDRCSPASSPSWPPP